MPEDTPKQKRKFPFDEARKSILTIPQVKEVKFLETDDGDLDGIRALADGSLPEKEISSRIQSVLLLDLDYQVDHRIIKVLSRSENTVQPSVRRRPRSETR